MDFKNQIKEELKKNRSTLSESSLKSYCSNLSNLPKKINKTDSIQSFTDDKNEYIEYINTLDNNNQTAKTLLSSLYIITLDDDYRNAMLEKNKIIQNNYLNQKKTNKQIKNEITYDDIVKKTKFLFELLKIDKSIINYQNYFLLSLMSGQIQGIEPRRNEWGNVKIKNYNKDNDNYIKKNNVIFNTFKTSKSKGQQIVKLPKSFMILLNRYLKISDNDNLFYNDDLQGLTSCNVTKRINKIFSPLNISCDILRSTYLTNMYKDLPPLADMEERAEKMGHSVMTALMCYVKKTDNIIIDQPCIMYEEIYTSKNDDFTFNEEQLH